MEENLKTATLTKSDKVYITLCILIAIFSYWRLTSSDDLTNASPHENYIAKLVLHKGKVRYKPKSDINWNTVGDKQQLDLSRNDKIYTEQDSFAKITVGDQVTVELGEETLVRIDQGQDEGLLNLLEGILSLNVPSGQKLRVRSKGKLFELTSSSNRPILLEKKSERIKVFSKAVEIKHVPEKNKSIFDLIFSSTPKRSERNLIKENFEMDKSEIKIKDLQVKLRETKKKQKETNIIALKPVVRKIIFHGLTISGGKDQVREKGNKLFKVSWKEIVSPKRSKFLEISQDPEFIEVIKKVNLNLEDYSYEFEIKESGHYFWRVNTEEESEIINASEIVVKYLSEPKLDLSHQVYIRDIDKFVELNYQVQETYSDDRVKVISKELNTEQETTLKVFPLDNGSQVKIPISDLNYPDLFIDFERGKFNKLKRRLRFNVIDNPVSDIKLSLSEEFFSQKERRNYKRIKSSFILSDLGIKRGVNQFVYLNKKLLTKKLISNRKNVDDIVVGRSGVLEFILRTLDGKHLASEEMNIKVNQPVNSKLTIDDIERVFKAKDSKKITLRWSGCNLCHSYDVLIDGKRINTVQNNFLENIIIENELKTQSSRSPASDYKVIPVTIRGYDSFGRKLASSNAQIKVKVINENVSRKNPINDSHMVPYFTIGSGTWLSEFDSPDNEGSLGTTYHTHFSYYSHTRSKLHYGMEGKVFSLQSENGAQINQSISYQIKPLAFYNFNLRPNLMLGAGAGLSFGSEITNLTNNNVTLENKIYFEPGIYLRYFAGENSILFVRAGIKVLGASGISYAAKYIYIQQLLWFIDGFSLSYKSDTSKIDDIENSSNNILFELLFQF